MNSFQNSTSLNDNVSTPMFITPIPLFRCEQGRDGSIDVSYCVLNKLLLTVDFAVIVLVIVQFVIYMIMRKIKYSKDARLWIFTLTLITSIYIFMHYGIINPSFRSKLYFLIELFVFINMFTICYYYIYKARGLFPNRKATTYIFWTFGIACIGINIFLGIAEDIKASEEKEMTCESWEF